MSKLGRRPPIMALLIDVSGTLHVGATPTLNAVNAFHKLRSSPISFRLCSNTSKESSASLSKRLENMGFDLSLKKSNGDTKADGRKDMPQQLLWTSIAAAAKLAKGMDLNRPLMLLSESSREEILSQLSKDNVNRCSSEELNENYYDSVIIGLAPSCFDYHHLNTAFRVLKGEGKISNPDSSQHKTISLIATHKAKYIETEDGLSLGPGPFVTALEVATGVAAHVVGKPSKNFFKAVIDDFRLEAQLEHPGLLGSIDDGSIPTSHRDKIAVIGDDVEADLGGGAHELGLWRVLVKTGKYRPGDETRAGVVPPDEVYDSFSDFVDSLLT